MFTDPLDHLRAELERLDLLLHREILRLRAAYALSLDEFQGLYVSDEHVDALIKQTTAQQEESVDIEELTERAELIRQRNAAEVSASLPWHHLVTEFELSPDEQDVLLIALAPEIDLKYEKLYAYLNNDVTRKWPTFDLALRILRKDDHEDVPHRRLLFPEKTLFGSGILRQVQRAQDRPSWLATGFAAALPVVRFVLGQSVRDAEIAHFSSVEVPIDTWEWDALPHTEQLVSELRRAVELFRKTPRSSITFVFEGASGSGRAQAARAMCSEMGLPLMRIDADALRASESLTETLQSLNLCQRLEPACVYLERGEKLFDSDGNYFAHARKIEGVLRNVSGPVIFTFAPSVPWRSLLEDRRVITFRFGDLDYEQRRTLWNAIVAGLGVDVPARVLDALADRFVLNAGQIDRVITTARDKQFVRCENGLSTESLFESARTESARWLGKLATKAKTIHTWSDLVLPPTTLRQVKEVTAAVKHRQLVYSGWGFETRITAGKGLKVLFTGTPGTGKTMTAGVMARDLGLDLYKVDLSGVVSKYIGETEKNLDKIFDAAHGSNSILFFDEADALFGKRSEVKDAHDRYANIEISYLLQKMEEHEGAVILATNLRQNIDDAFSRRMHYVVEFPMPDESYREKLWRGMFPQTVPLGEDVDFHFLARQFVLSGGDIQNVALDAAFLAAQNGRVVTMCQLVNAMARQLRKQGRVLSASDFRQYHGLIT